MSQLPQELIETLQSVIESCSGEDPPSETVRLDLRQAMKSGSLPITSIFEALTPVAYSLPEKFLDLLGDEAQRHLNESGEVIDDHSLGFVEEAVLRSSAVGRWHWMTLLALIQSPSSLDIFVREIIESQNVEGGQVLKAFAPLMQRPEFEPEWLFPELFAAINHSVLAPVVFDFANFCFREGLCDEHPAYEKRSEYLALLDQLAQRMLEIESDPTSWSEDFSKVSKMISDSVALIVALCDTMSQLNFTEAIEVIQKVSTIKHRRIRAESTFCLAKLGISDGSDALIELAAEPVSRLRVISYAEELGIDDEIDEKFRTPVALAESELALWMSQPNQMGLPPSSIEAVDQRSLFWPGFDDPVDCFLFRFEYRNGDNSYSNLAIVGPMVHAFMSKLDSLEVDDVYAAFAGWQAEHEEIFELVLSDLSPHRQTDLFKLERRLNDFGATQIETRIMAVFFGEVLIVAECLIDEKPVIAFADGNNIRAFEKTSEMPITEETVYAIYKGSKLISAFNQ